MIFIDEAETLLHTVISKACNNFIHLFVYVRNISVKKMPVVLVIHNMIGLFGLFSLLILLLIIYWNYTFHILSVCKVLISDRKEEMESKSGEGVLFYCVLYSICVLATACASCSKYTSSWGSIFQTVCTVCCQGKDNYMPDTKESVCETCWSCLSWIIHNPPLHTAGETNLALGKVSHEVQEIITVKWPNEFNYSIF